MYDVPARADGLVDLGEVVLDDVTQIVQQLGLLGDVGGELHYLVGPPHRIEDRIVGGLNPDFLAAFAEALVLL